MATSSNSVEFKLVGRDQTKAAIDQASRNLRSLEQNARSTSLSLGTLAKGFAVFQIGSKLLDGVKAVAGFNVSLEQTQLAFQTLLGSADAAEKRVRSLVEFSAKTPFEMQGVQDANRLLQALTGGALATQEGMRLVGDAAAAAGRDLQETSMWIGRLYAGLESGTPVGEATMRLLEMGLISGDTKRELEAMTSEALGSSEAMRVLEETFGATAGAMELQSKSMGGMITTLKDFTLQAISQMPLVEGAFESAKQALESLLKAAGALEETNIRPRFTEIRQSLLDAANAGEISAGRFSQLNEMLARFYRAENSAGMEMIAKQLKDITKSTEALTAATAQNIEITKEQQALIDSTLQLSDKMALDLLDSQEKQIELARRQVDAYIEQNMQLKEQGQIDTQMMRERIDLAGQWLEKQYQMLEAQNATAFESGGMGQFAEEDAFIANIESSIERAKELQGEYQQWEMDNILTMREAETIAHNERLAEIESLQIAELEKMDLIERERQAHAAQMKAIAENQANAEAAARDNVARHTARGFGNMASAAAVFFGQQSAAYKAFAIGEAIANTFRAANQVMADPTVIAWAKIPLAATVIAAGIANVASIAQAHSGATNIPSEGTYLLNRGERVLAPEQNRDLTDALERGGMGGGATQIIIDGEILAQTINQMASDGRLTIPARAVA